MKHNFKTLNTFDMKQIIKYLQQSKQWILFVVTNRIFVGLVLNIVYFGIIGIYFTWCTSDGATNWVWWVKLIIFAILINVHRYIYKLIVKYGW